jgi:hypothetical protein
MILWKKVFSFPVQYLTLLQYSSRMLTSRWQESKGSFVLSQYLLSILYTHLLISLKFVFNEKPPLLNINLSPVKLSNFWDCLARNNFEQNWKICWVVLPLTSVILCSIVWTFMLLILLGVYRLRNYVTLFYFTNFDYIFYILSIYSFMLIFLLKCAETTKLFSTNINNFYSIFI